MLSTSGSARKKPARDVSGLTFERLSQNYGAGAFTCGIVQIDNWFARRAYQDHNDLLCRVVTAHLPGENQPVGFYSMCLTQESESQFENYSLLKKVRYFFTDKSMLVCKLEWVAVGTDFQCEGIGKLLMGRAIKEFAEVVQRTGVFALILQAIGDRAQRFYQDLGFEEYGDPGLRKMILPALSVIEAIERDPGLPQIERTKKADLSE